MSDNLEPVVAALKSENASLKQVIEGLLVDKTTLRQTVYDILEANLNLKAGAAHLEKQVTKHLNDLSLKDREIEDLKKSLDQLNQKLAEHQPSEQAA